MRSTVTGAMVIFLSLPGVVALASPDLPLSALRENATRIRRLHHDGNPAVTAGLLPLQPYELADDVVRVCNLDLSLALGVAPDADTPKSVALSGDGSRMIVGLPSHNRALVYNVNRTAPPPSTPSAPGHPCHANAWTPIFDSNTAAGMPAPAPTGLGTSVAIGEDGNTILMAASDAPGSLLVYKTEDSGVNWTPKGGALTQVVPAPTRRLEEAPTPIPTPAPPPPTPPPPRSPERIGTDVCMNDAGTRVIASVDHNDADDAIFGTQANNERRVDYYVWDYDAASEAWSAPCRLSPEDGLSAPPDGKRANSLACNSDLSRIVVQNQVWTHVGGSSFANGRRVEEEEEESAEEGVRQASAFNVDSGSDATVAALDAKYATQLSRTDQGRRLGHHASGPASHNEWWGYPWLPITNYLWPGGSSDGTQWLLEYYFMTGTSPSLSYDGYYIMDYPGQVKYWTVYNNIYGSNWVNYGSAQEKPGDDDWRAGHMTWDATVAILGTKGHAKVYSTPVGGGWTLRWSMPDPNSDSYYDVKIDRDGEVVAIGSDDDARVFRRSGWSFTQVGAAISKSSGSQGFAEERCNNGGMALSKGGKYFAVSEPSANSGSGRVRVFHWTGASWTNQLDVSGPGGGAEFGVQIEMNSAGTVLVLGVAVPVDLNNNGVLKSYKRSGSTWTETVLPRPSGTGSSLGYRLAMGAEGNVVIATHKVSPTCGNCASQARQTITMWRSDQGSNWVVAIANTYGARITESTMHIKLSPNGKQLIFNGVYKLSAGGSNLSPLPPPASPSPPPPPPSPPSLPPPSPPPPTLPPPTPPPPPSRPPSVCGYDVLLTQTLSFAVPALGRRLEEEVEDKEEDEEEAEETGEGVKVATEEDEEQGGDFADGTLERETHRRLSHRHREHLEDYAVIELDNHRMKSAGAICNGAPSEIEYDYNNGYWYACMDIADRFCAVYDASVMKCPPRTNEKYVRASNVPKGCSFHTGTGIWHYNVHATGGSNHLLRPICKIPPPPPSPPPSPSPPPPP